MASLLVVFSATGQQGGSVVQTVLADPDLSKRYRIRGTTRDPSQESAKALAEKGVEIVKADIDDAASLQAAFTGAAVVFGSTVTIYDGKAYEHEVAHGRAIADAAVKAKVPYLIYSTLPNGGKISGGQFKNMGHFDGKAEVEEYIRGLPLRSAFFAPGSFMSNFHASMAPHPVGNGTYALAGPVGPDTQLPLIDTADDTGKWVAAILADLDKYEGQVLCAATKLYSFKEIVEAMSKATGKTVTYNQVPENVWRGFLPPTMADHITEMLLYFEQHGYYGPESQSKIAWAADQARGKLTTLEEWLRQNPLKLQ